MPRYVGNSDYRHGTTESLGILAANLGTPDAPTTPAVRSVSRGVPVGPAASSSCPRPLWWLILHGVILRIRPRRSAEAYAQVWTDEGSPLLVWSEKQVAGLQKELSAALPGPVHVALGMRYGQPSIESALDSLRAANVRRLLVLPLYPQYSATTTGSTFDAVAAALSQWRWLPDLRMISDYHAEPGYIDRARGQHPRALGGPRARPASGHELPRSAPPLSRGRRPLSLLLPSHGPAGRRHPRPR